MNKDNAFTLAEVLITLTIIGVIAAITIPNLMQSYRKHQVEVGVKESYSLLNNALNMAKAEHGDLRELIDSSNADVLFFAENYLVPYLKVTGKCEKGYDRKCKIYGGPDNYTLKCLDGTKCGKNYTNVLNLPKYILANGMYIFVDHASNNNKKSFSFAVDINGEKGPNQIGHDIFHFALEYDSPNRLLGAPSSLFLRKDYEYYYACDDQFGGVYCVNKIMYNSWKIPDDYPVKKW